MKLQNKKKKFEHTPRVAMIGHKRVPSREGGVEVVVWELAQRLRDRGYEVECYNRAGYLADPHKYEHIKGKHGVYKDGIRIITVPTVSNGKLNAIIYSFFATIRSLFGHYDVIHYHAEGPCLMLWLPKLFRVRIIATIHGLDWQRAKWGNFASRMLRAGEKMAAMHADEVIVLSKNVQEYFLKEYGRETLYIPNGIRRSEKRTTDLIRQKYGLQGNDYIFTLSRIVPEKGIHYLLEAFSGIETDKKLLSVGGSGNAEEYMEEIKVLAAEDPRVIIGGFVQGDLLEEICSNAYVFALPSDVEGMSISLLEAMSYGNCCLVSDIKENLEVTEDKAMTFHAGDVKDLQTKLQKLVDDPDLVENYCQNSADFICRKYNWDKMTEQTIALYKGNHIIE